MNDEPISISAAAREIGVHKSTLARQLKGSAIEFHEGKVRLSDVLAYRASAIDLTRSGRRDGRLDALDGAPSDPTLRPADATTPDVDATLDDDGAGPVEVDGAPMSYADARALKETYVAWLRKLEFDTKRGDLAPVAEMVAFVERMFATVRELLLGLPGKLSGDLTDEQVDRLTAEIHEALEELSDPHAFLDGAPSLDDEIGDGGDGAPPAPAPEPRRVGRAVPVRRSEDQRRPR